MKRILIVCAHPDDEILGCGGTLMKHSKKKDEINILFVFEGSSARYQNKKNKNLLKDIAKREKSAIRVSKILKAKSISFLRYPNLTLNFSSLLEVTKDIEKKIIKIKPDIIYTHTNKDLNLDHRLCHQSVITAVRPSNNLFINKILAFEIPSSTEWALGTFGNFNPNYFVNISNFFKNKMELLKIYHYELRPFPHPRSKESIEAQARLSGTQCGFRNSERFEVIRELKK